MPDVPGRGGQAHRSDHPPARPVNPPHTRLWLEQPASLGMLRAEEMQRNAHARAGRGRRSSRHADPPPVKLGIVSDIHCNLAGLEAALAAMGPVDVLLCLGDAIDRFRFSNAVIGRLRALGAQLILGNHEEIFLSEAGLPARARAEVDAQLVEYLAAQPPRRMLNFDGRKVLMVHSTPWEPRGAYIYPHSPKLARFAEAGADFVLYGHTHAPLIRRIGGVLVINPGSAGDGRDTGHGRHLSCAVLDPGTGEARLIDYLDPRFPAPP